MNPDFLVIASSDPLGHGGGEDASALALDLAASGKCVGVSEGDTNKVRLDGQETKIRLWPGTHLRVTSFT